MNYYYTDGRERFGPFSLEELKGKNLTMDTLVWREGLTDWIPAGNLDELKPFFQESTYTSTFDQSNIANRPPMPKSWLVEAILITILCCLPFGIVAIILSMKSESFWNLGEYKAAQMLSEESGRWIKIGLICGVIFWFLSFMFMFMVRSMADTLNEQVI